MTKYAQTDISRIERLVLKHARDAFVSERKIAAEWQELNYTARPDFHRAVEEYEGFVETLEDFGIAIDYLPANPDVGLDSIYPRDTAILCERGAILCNMAKPQRRSEPKALAEALRALGIPILGAVEGEGRLEGGDVAWIDRRTLAVGLGRRTNQAGIDQLGKILGDSIDELLVVPLPDYRAPGEVFHLMSMFSPIDHDLALVYSPLIPASFRHALLSKGIELLEVPDSEFESMACNALAVAPRVCLTLAGNPLTRERLERAGVEVHTYEGREISLKAGGGPTCLTLPISRE